MYNKNGEWKKFTLQYGLDLRVSRGRGRIAGVIKTPYNVKPPVPNLFNKQIKN